MALTSFFDCFTAVRDSLFKNYMWEPPVMLGISSAYYAARKKEADLESLKTCRKLLNAKREAFGADFLFPPLPMAAFLCSLGSAEKGAEKMEKAYQALRREFYASPSLVQAALFLSGARESEFEEKVQTIKKWCEIFSVLAPSVRQGSGFAPYLFLSASHKSPQKCADDACRCYLLLKKAFQSEEAVKGMSLILSLSDEPSGQKCQRVIDTFDALKKKHKKFGGGAELVLLAAAVLVLENPVETLSEKQKLLISVRYPWDAAWQKDRLTWAAYLAVLEKAEEINNPYAFLIAPMALSLILAQSLNTGENIKNVVKL